MPLSRRVFLKAGAVAAIGLAGVPRFLLRAAAASTAIGGRKILVVVFQRGAADGLNMVVPYAEPAYYAARPTVAIAPPAAGRSDAALDLDGFFGLHPALTSLEPLYAAGRLAVIHAAGSPDTTRSHFDAQDFMETATPGQKTTPDGWLNRALQADALGAPSPFRAAALGPRLPRSLVGPVPALALTTADQFALRVPNGSGLPAAFATMYGAGRSDPVSAAGRETFKAVRLLQTADPSRYRPTPGVRYPPGPFGKALEQIAQLIKAEVGLEIACADSGEWDTHVAQGGAEGQLAMHLRELGDGLAAFHQDLGERMQHVVVLTMSEFGRTVRENGNRGTDHGHGNVMFLLGGPVAGGRVYGAWPGLAAEQLFEGRDLALTTDFRDVFAEALSRHMGLASLTGVFPGYAVSSARFRGMLKSSTQAS